MFRTIFGYSARVFLLAAMAAVAGLAPAPAWGAKPGVSPADKPSALPAVTPSAAASAQSPDLDDDDSSSLTAIGDFNRDGLTDVAKIVSGDGRLGAESLTILLGQADGTYKQVASMPLAGHDAKDIVVGDFNGDGITDVLTGDDDGALMLFLGDGTGKMTSAGVVAHLSSVVSMAVGDFNHDGVLDVAVSDWRGSTVTVLLGTAKGSFQNAESFPLRMPGTTPHVTVADFNGDGIPDLAVVYDDDEGDTYDVMLGNGSGAFTFAPSLSLVRDPNSHCVT